MKLLWVAAALSVCAWGGDWVFFRSGQHQRVERAERKEGKVILHQGAGAIEVPATEVVRIETDPAKPAVPPPTVTESKVMPDKPRLSPQEVVVKAAERYGLPPALLDVVARVESGYRVDAVSPKGAVGLMQLMPGTAAQLRADPLDPEQNADAGARYLRELLERYNYSAHRALAAYNAGPGAVDKYRGVPPFAETRTYVDRVLGEYLRRVQASGGATAKR